MWQLRGKGPLFKSSRVPDGKGGTQLILNGYRKGKLVSIESNSWQMLKKAGWDKVRK